MVFTLLCIILYSTYQNSLHQKNPKLSGLVWMSNNALSSLHELLQDSELHNPVSDYSVVWRELAAKIRQVVFPLKKAEKWEKMWQMSVKCLRVLLERWSSSKMPCMNWTAVHTLFPLQKLYSNWALTFSKIVIVFYFLDTVNLSVVVIENWRS